MNSRSAPCVVSVGKEHGGSRVVSREERSAGGTFFAERIARRLRDHVRFTLKLHHNLVFLTSELYTCCLLKAPARLNKPLRPTINRFVLGYRHFLFPCIVIFRFDLVLQG
jgi:hypothetical protein